MFNKLFNRKHKKDAVVVKQSEEDKKVIREFEELMAANKKLLDQQLKNMEV